MTDELSRKRVRSSPSPDSDRYKKLREYFSSVSSTEEESTIMAEGNVPGSVEFLEDIDKMLTEKLGKMKSEIMDKLSEKFNVRLDKLETDMQEVQNDNKGLNDEVENLKDENCQLWSELTKMRKIIMTDQADLADLEQYSRKNNIRIFGLPDDQNPAQKDSKESVIKLIKDTLMITDVTIEHIEAAHRLPSNKPGPKPVIVRFRSRDQKSLVLKKRKELKGKGISIQDDIGKRTMLLMNRLKKDPKIKEVWFWNNKVFAKNLQGQIDRGWYGKPVGDMFTNG